MKIALNSDEIIPAFSCKIVILRSFFKCKKCSHISQVDLVALQFLVCLFCACKQILDKTNGGFMSMK